MPRFEPGPVARLVSWSIRGREVWVKCARGVGCTGVAFVLGFFPLTYLPINNPANLSSETKFRANRLNSPSTPAARANASRNDEDERRTQQLTALAAELDIQVSSHVPPVV